MRAPRCVSRALGRALAMLALGAVGASLTALAAEGSPSPAQHFPLVPVGGEPLALGFVEVIHPDGPQVYARHVYELNGAEPNQSYQVVISIWTSNVTCSGAPALEIPAAVVVTNISGNGHADVVLTPEMVDGLGIRGLTIGGKVTLFRGESPAYTTGCEVIQLD